MFPKVSKVRVPYNAGATDPATQCYTYQYLNYSAVKTTNLAEESIILYSNVNINSSIDLVKHNIMKAYEHD
jgi:hypothetical protein